MAAFQKPAPRLTPESAPPHDLMVSAGLKESLVKNEATPLYEKYRKLFVRAGGVDDVHGGGTLEEPLFCAWAAQYYGLSGAHSSMVFRAFDFDDSRRLNRHEFSLLLRSLDHYSGRLEHPSFPPALSVRWLAHCSSVVINPTSNVRVVLDPFAVVAQPSGPKACSAAHGTKAMVADFSLDPALQTRAGDDWRGALATARGSAENVLAKAIVKNAQLMVEELKRAPDQADGTWLRDGLCLRQLLGTKAGEGEEAEQASMLGLLSADVRRVAAGQPTVTRVPANCKVFGDVHGQFRDLLMLFASNGFPNHYGGDIEHCAYVFNGDFVDRGLHQVEVVTLLFALKSLYPARVFLNRGNHEFRWQNLAMSRESAAYGFDKNCISRFPTRHEEVFESIHSAFDWLPFASVVGGKVLVLHGGIGDGSWTIRDLEAIERPVQDDHDASRPELKCVKQALWSDPSSTDEVPNPGVHRMKGRGDVPDFTADQTLDFCKREGVDIIIRSHEYMPQGYKLYHRGHLITVFSARNYCDSVKNDAAIVILKFDELGQLRATPHRHLQRAAEGGK